MAAPLRDRLVAAIRANGPMTIAAYMEACLGDREGGYYQTREPFGAKGDFVTAPEVSQIFGELIGAWVVATWEHLGAPTPFALVEPGPGRGTLMADLLRVARLRPRFLAAAELHLVETSARLRALQGQTLAPFNIVPKWHDRLGEVPEMPLLVVANEFFDALPIRQLVRQDGAWAERMVGVDESGGLCFGLRPTGPQDEEGADAPAGAVREIAAPAAAAMTEIAGRIVGQGGAALVIDYGYSGPAFGDTLQAVSRHRPVDPLALPGDSDLTAHVDFTALAGAARAVGAEAVGPVGQGAFLSALGLHARAERLAAGKDAATRDVVISGVARLADPDGMGELFKVLGVTRPGMSLSGFD